MLESLDADIKKALLGGDKLVATTLRMLKSELKNAEIAAGGPLSEDATLKIISKEAKKRIEAAEAFSKSSKPDLEAKEREEAVILQAYLPAQADRGAVEAFVKELVASNPGIQRGDAIRQTLAHFSGTTDGKVVSELVASYL